MFRMLDQAAEFQRRLGVPIPDAPTQLSSGRKVYAIGHLEEELTEFNDAQTLVDELDALLDIAYVALSRVVEMGLAPGPAYDAVQLSNMTRTPVGRTTRSEFDAIKQPGVFEEPLLQPLLEVTTDDLELLREVKSALSHIAEEMKS